MLLGLLMDVNANTITSNFKRRRSSITQQLLAYQDMFTGLFMKRSSRSFSCDTDTSDSRSEEFYHQKNKRERFSSVNIPTLQAKTESSSDLIQLKSPTSPNADGNKPPGIATVPTRRRSADVATSPTYHTEHDRVSQIATFDRLSTVVTPTATSFSRDDLNEIFNISRESMEFDKSMNNKTNEDTLSESSIEMSSPDKHNQAMDESNISLDSTLTESPMTGLNDDNNNTKNENETNPNTKHSLGPLDISNQTLPMTPSPKKNMTPFSTPQTPADLGGSGSRTSSLSKMQMVCREIFMTEKSYVKDLQDIIEGYIYHLKQKGDLEVESIFGNLEDIYEFNKEVLYQIEQCEMDDYEIDPIQLAKVFIDKARGFNNHYVSYCTNYPEASQFFSLIMQDPGIAAFFLERQKIVGHVLSLESYLLKPVQRIMKYYLLFKDILKRYEGDEQGYDIINMAVLAMMDVAEYINEMKRLHENAVKVQEILNNVIYIDVPIDVYATGRLVLENTFKVQGVRSERIMYLFEKLLLICKKREDNFLLFKEKIQCCNMMLVESIAKDPLGFQIMRFDNRKVNYTIIAKTTELKNKWTNELKRLILENHAAVIPQTARQAILGEEKAKSKYNSLQFQALDDSVMTNLKKVGAKSPMNKENAITTAGVKRESNEKESAFSPKRPLNSKAKEYLQEKKNRNSGGSPVSSPLTPPLSQKQPAIQSGGEKEKKEKHRWMKRHKHKASLDGTINLNESSSSDMHTDDHEEQPSVKSRSLESLKDAMKEQEHVYEEINSNILKDIINYNFQQQVDDTIQEIQPMQTNTDDVSLTTGTDEATGNRPTSIAVTDPMTDTDTDQDSYTLTTEQTEQAATQNPNNEEQFTSGIRITKSNSVALRKKGGSADDILNKSYNENNQQRWSSVPDDSERLKRLEHRLSLLNDDADDLSITSIKNMVRKVSNAFNSTYQTYEDSPGSNTSIDSNVSRDLGKILGTPMRPIKQKISYRKSTGGILNTHEPLLEKDDPNRPQSECSNYKAKDLESVSSMPIDDKEEEISDSNEELSKRWSTDVDQVFDEVNADLDSIADSIASDAGRNETEEAPTYVVTSVGMDIAHRAAIVDMRLKEANSSESTLSPASTKKVNVEVKRVADRIKEYKRLVDAEKRRTSWRRREPKTMNEVMENLDNINSTNSGLTPTYSNLRRRYRTSRDFDGSSINSSSDPSPRSSYSSIKRSLSENFVGSLENSTSVPASYSSTPRHEQPTAGSDTEKTLTQSVNALVSRKDKVLDNTEDITTRTEKYKKALKNVDAKARLPSTGEVKMEQTVILRRRSKNQIEALGSENVVCRNSGDWTRKAQTLPHPKRTNAIKRVISRTDSEELSDEADSKLTRSIDEKHNDSSSTDAASSDENKTTIVVSKKTHRSTSLPRQKKRHVSNTIHEEVSSKYVNPRLSTRSASNPGQPPRALARGREARNNTKNNNDQNKYMSLPRGRRRETKTEGNEKTGSSVRSVSLPRRAPATRNRLSPQNSDENKENEEEPKSSSITILRNPSIRCIQSNHVHNRIKDYFTHLQKTTEVSCSRPNLVIIGNSCSDSDPETSSNDDRTSNDESNNNITEKDQIAKGTVQSMIQRYGKQNYIFD